MSAPAPEPTAIVWPDRIKCLRCGMTSHNVSDVAYKYCGNCHKFHNAVTAPPDELSALRHAVTALFEACQSLLEIIERAPGANENVGDVRALRRARAALIKAKSAI